MEFTKDAYVWGLSSMQVKLGNGDAVFHLSGNGFDCPSLVEIADRDSTRQMRQVNYITSEQACFGYWFMAEGLQSDQMADFKKTLEEIRAETSGISVLQNRAEYYVKDAKRVHGAMRELCERTGLVQINNAATPESGAEGSNVFFLRPRGRLGAPAPAMLTA